MREEFCTQCGSKITNGECCPRCGARVDDAGKNPSMLYKLTCKIKSLHIRASSVWFYAGLSALSVVAAMLIIACFRAISDFGTYVNTYDGHIFLIPYYLIGFLPVLSLISVFFQRKFSGRYAGGAAQSLLLLVLSSAVLTLKVILKDTYMDSGVHFLSYMICLEYGVVISESIFFEIAAFILFLLGKRCSKNEQMKFQQMKSRQEKSNAANHEMR